MKTRMIRLGRGKRLDVGGLEILDSILDGFGRLSCDTQGSPRNNFVWVAQ